MIYEIFIGLAVLACFLYYIFCLLELSGIVKFTDKNTTIEFPKWLIPFYYFFKSNTVSKRERELQSILETNEKKIAELMDAIDEQKKLNEILSKAVKEGDNAPKKSRKKSIKE